VGQDAEGSIEGRETEGRKTTGRENEEVGGINGVLGRVRGKWLVNERRRRRRSNINTDRIRNMK
jgi:hypothetical protein